MNDSTQTRLAELDSSIRASAFAFIRDARLDGAPVVIVESRRSPARQAALYAQGRTTRGPIVTWTLNSRHLTGRAFDIAFLQAGRVTFDVPRTWWEYMGAMSARYGLRWGPSIGLRSDLGHFEI